MYRKCKENVILLLDAKNFGAIVFFPVVTKTQQEEARAGWPVLVCGLLGKPLPGKLVSLFPCTILRHQKSNDIEESKHQRKSYQPCPKHTPLFVSLPTRNALYIPVATVHLPYQHSVAAVPEIGSIESSETSFIILAAKAAAYILATTTVLIPNLLYSALLYSINSEHPSTHLLAL